MIEMKSQHCPDCQNPKQEGACAYHEIVGLRSALAQARAELEAVKKERDLWYSQRNEAIEGAQALKKRAEYLQAKLAAAEKRGDESQALAASEFDARMQADATVQALTRALKSHHRWNEDGECGVKDCQAHFYKDDPNLPASVKARIERWEAMEAVVAIAKKDAEEFDACMNAQRKDECYEPHMGDGDDEACGDGVCFKVSTKRIKESLARLSALDQKSKRDGEAKR